MYSMASQAQKTESFTMRIRPEIKAALAELARLESRTASAQIEAMVRARCKELGLAIPLTEVPR